MLQQYSTLEKTATRLSNESLLRKRDELKSIRDEAQKLLDSVNEEFGIRMDSENTNTLLIANRKVTRTIVNSFSKVSIAVARKWHATKISPDTDTLRNLFKEGNQIEGMTSYARIDVR